MVQRYLLYVPNSNGDGSFEKVNGLVTYFSVERFSSAELHIKSLCGELWATRSVYFVRDKDGVPEPDSLLAEEEIKERGGCVKYEPEGKFILPFGL